MTLYQIAIELGEPNSHVRAYAVRKTVGSAQLCSMAVMLIVYIISMLLDGYIPSRQKEEIVLTQRLKIGTCIIYYYDLVTR